MPPGAFRPIPKVWSTVARLRVREGADVADERLFLRVVGAGFAQKRKTIFNNLRSAPEDLRVLTEAAGGAAALLESAGIDPRRRAEDVDARRVGGSGGGAARARGLGVGRGDRPEPCVILNACAPLFKLLTAAGARPPYRRKV